MTNPVAFSLGSNIGDRAKHLADAVMALTEFVKITAVSSLYETPPWGNTDQDPFYNICVTGICELEPTVLLGKTQAIEQQIGRVKRDHWGPREIDVDMLYYGEEQIVSEALTVPHKLMHERAFVLLPLAEIASGWLHPVRNEMVRSMVSAVSTTDIKKLDIPLPIKRQPLLDWTTRTYIMGILNITPDSFSGDGLIQQDYQIDYALAQAKRMLREGADVLDIGGQSTRPTFETVTPQMELNRVLPVIKAIRKNMPHVLISIDTYYAEVAEKAIAAGADWVNDIWGLQFDDAMADVVARANCPVVMMHNGRNRPKADDPNDPYYGYHHYDDLIPDMITDLQKSIRIAKDAGVPNAHIIIDPGVGFGKNAEQNKVLIKHLEEFKQLGFPILLGASRKGFIGKALGGLSADKRIEGTVATTVLGIERGANIVRVHDVKENYRAARMTDAVLKS